MLRNVVLVVSLLAKCSQLCMTDEVAAARHKIFRPLLGRFSLDDKSLKD